MISLRAFELVLCRLLADPTPKSTLINAMVGQKIAITANQPETTRRVIRGIVQLDHGQLIIAVDTRRDFIARVRYSVNGSTTWSGRPLSDVDAVALCMPADEPTGPGDRFLLELVKRPEHLSSPLSPRRTR